MIVVTQQITTINGEIGIGPVENEKRISSFFKTGIRRNKQKHKAERGELTPGDLWRVRHFP